MYVLLTGAKKNLGDFLIGDRTLALLRHFKPKAEFVRMPSWLPLDSAAVDEASALIILGGPGYQPNFYPGIYPLRSPLEGLRRPIVPLGMGWKGIPGDAETEERYTFAPQALEALRWIASRTRWLGCRDIPTATVLRRHGLYNTLMTGCPVWYHLASLGTAMRLPQCVERLLFTPPQHVLYAEQSIRVAEVLSQVFPSAERICAFHRGLSDWSTRRIADSVRGLGFEVRDVSGGVEKSDFYAQCHLHVGYRVHAHLQFLSERRPSLLLHEDGRGIGASGALELRGLDAFRRTRLSKASGLLPIRRIEVLEKHLPLRYEPDPSLPVRLRAVLRLDLETQFARYAGVGSRIDAHFPIMERFIASIP